MVWAAVAAGGTATTPAAVAEGAAAVAAGALPSVGAHPLAWKATRRAAGRVAAAGRAAPMAAGRAAAAAAGAKVCLSSEHSLLFNTGWGPSVDIKRSLFSKCFTLLVIEGRGAELKAVGCAPGDGGHRQGPPRSAVAQPEPARDAAGFQTVSAHPRTRRERDAEAARSAAGPPGLFTKEEPKRAAVSNKFDLLNLEAE